MKTVTSEMTKDEEYEAVVEKLRLRGVHVPPKGSWQKRIGAMAGSKHFDEALRLGAEWREQVNRESIEALNADS
jgi:hypothetical protein